MELQQYLSALWKWIWLIVLATVVAMASSYWATAQMPRIYKASTTLQVGQFTQPDITTQELWTMQQLAQSYVHLARRQPIELPLDLGDGELAALARRDGGGLAELAELLVELPDRPQHRRRVPVEDGLLISNACARNPRLGHKPVSHNDDVPSSRPRGYRDPNALVRHRFKESQ